MITGAQQDAESSLPLAQVPNEPPNEQPTEHPNEQPNDQPNEQPNEQPTEQPIGEADSPASIARLYGEPLFEVPRDLYIPPNALEIILDAFEGPLDLLLYLIRKQNFNILDIPMAQLTAQYLEYVEQIRHSNFELAAEYLLMAAVLIEIKSRMLLPKRSQAEDEEVGDPRAELVRRLLEYERFKLAAQQIDALPVLGRDFHLVAVPIEASHAIRLPSVEARELQLAWLDVLKRAKLVAHHRITREPLSVREHMTIILRRLNERKFFEFTELFEPAIRAGGGVAIVVVHFLALLELVRESLVDLTQAEAFAPIYIRLNYSPVDEH